jgi:DegV family protein with EDD domain
MSKIALITDSAVDFDAALRRKFGIADYVHGVVVRPDGTQFLADLDWHNISSKDYYGSMARGHNLYKTATCSIAEVEDLFKKHFAAGEDILGLTIGSAFSGSYNLFKTIAERIQPQFPERKIAIIDTCRYGGAYGLLAISAHNLIKEGKSLEEVADFLNANKLKTHQMGPLDDLFFLNRSGRVSKTIAIMGTMVGIRPLADFQANGFCQPIGKIKGLNAALEATVKYVKATISDAENATIVVSHSNRPEAAKKLVEMIRKEIHPKEIVFTEIGQITGANLGPGLCAAFYYGEEVSPACEKEKAVMAQILGK